MRIWFERSEKERGTAYLGAEHEGMAGFARLHIGARGLLHAASCLSAAVMLRKLAARRRDVARAERAARRRGRLGGRLRGKRR